MHTIYRDAIGIATTGFFTLTAFSASAAIVDFEIDFFDDDVLIGEGSFSYDDEGKTCIEIAPPGDCSRTLSDEFFGLETIFVENGLTNFTASIYGVKYGGSFYKWWADKETGQELGQVSFNRFGVGRIDENRWNFGISDSTGVEFLTMDFEQASETFGTGDWNQIISPVIDPPSTLPVDPASNISDTGGTFEARRVGTTSPQQPDSTSVPEPSNIFGALIAMVLGYRAKRRLAKANK